MDLGTIQYNVEANTTDLDRANKAVDEMGEQAQKTGADIDAMSKKAEAAFRKTATEAEKATARQIRDAEKAARRIQDENERAANAAQKHAEKTARILQEEAKKAANAQIRESERAAKIVAQQAAIASMKQQKAAEQATKKIQEEAAKAARTAQNQSRGVMQNLGWQTQDAIVQLQMGTAAATVFSQQGSQMASAWNPMLGLFVAVAGVVGGALYNAFGNAATSTEDLGEKIKELNKDFTTLVAEQKAYLEGLEIKKQQDLAQAMIKQREEVNRLALAYEQAQERMSIPLGQAQSMGVGSQLATTDRDLIKINDDLRAARALLATTNQDVAESEKNILRINGEAVDGDEKKLTTSQELIKSLENERAKLDLVGGAMANYLADKSKATEEERALIQMLYMGNEARKDIEEQNKKDAKALEDANKKALDDESRRAESIKKLNEQMKREADLFGVTSKEAQVLYDIKAGLIKVTGGLAGAEAQALITSAKRLDQQQKEKEELEAYADNYRSWAKEQEKLDEEANKKRLEFSEDAAERINGAFAGAWVGIMDDADSAFDGIANSFKQLLAEMAHEALTKPIVMNIQQKMSGGGGTSAQGASSAIGAGGWWGVLAVAVAAGANEYNKQQEKLFSEMTAEFRQGNQSIGTILGEANKKSDSISGSLESLGDLSGETLNVNRGMYQALIDIRGGIAGVASGFARQFGISGVGTSASLEKSDTFGFNKSAINIGDAGADLFFGGLGDDLFGGQVNDFVKGFMGGLTTKISKALYSNKTKVIDSGIQFIGQGLADILTGATIEAFAYADIQTKKKTFGITTSNKVKTQQEELDAILLGQFTDVFSGAGDVLSQAAGVFGLDFQNYIDKLIINPQKLSLKDLEGDELTKEIESFFSSTLDNWAGVLTDGSGVLEKFQQVGEGAFETVIRLAGELNVFNQYADMLNLNFDSVGFAAVDASQNIIDFAGGIDQLTSSLSGYYKNFFTEEERAAKQMEMLAKELQELGINSVPANREAFRDLIEGIDLTTAAGQKQFAALINLQGVFAELVPITEELVQNTEDYAKSALSLLERSVDAEKKIINGQIDLLESSLASSRAVFGALESSLNGLVISSSRTQAANRRQAQAQISGMLGAARGGALPDINALNDALSVISQPSENLYSTFEDYATDFYRTAADIKALQDIAGEQVGTDEKALSELQKQSELLDDIVLWGREQIDIMAGVDTRITSVADALIGLSSIIGVTYPTVEQQKMIAQMAQSSEQTRSDLKVSQDATNAAIQAQAETMKSFIDYVEASQLSIVDNTDKIKKVLEKFDAIGMPLRDESIAEIVDPIVDAVTP